MIWYYSPPLKMTIMKIMTEKHYVEVRKDFILSPRELQTQKIGHVW